jgi:cobalt-precorrin-6B (C15)-methyltransferase
MIPDRDFFKDKQVPGPTKEDIRCLVMCKLQPHPQEIALEIGHGTGGLTVELSKRVQTLYTIDKNPQALKITKKNLDNLNPKGKVKLIEGDALTVMSEVPQYDILLVGGSSGDLEPILKRGVERLKSGGRVLITSILLETRVIALETLKEIGLSPEVIEVIVARGEQVASGTMMKGGNPVAIVWAAKP